MIRYLRKNINNYQSKAIVLLLQMATKKSQKLQQAGNHGCSNKDGAVIQVHYFNFRGTCQPIIHLLYYLNLPFEIVYEEKNQQNYADVGFNIGIPFIEDGEIRLHQTVAIMHYLCMKYEKYTMIGLTPQSTARSHQILMKYFAQRKRINTVILQAICLVPTKPDKMAFVQSFLKNLCFECKYLDYCLRKLAKGNVFVLEDFTIVDFLFYQTCFYVSGFFGKYISNNCLYRFFKEFKNRFQSLPFFEKNKKQIQQVPLFMSFNDQVVNTAIEETWEGGPYKLLNRS